MALEISIKVPDPLADRLGQHWGDLPQHALEVLVADACRHELLTPAEAQAILGLRSRYDVDGFLKQAGVLLDYTAEDLVNDLRTYGNLSSISL